MLDYVLNQWIESISFESALYDIKEKIGVQYCNTMNLFPCVLSFHVNTSHHVNTGSVQEQFFFVCCSSAHLTRSILFTFHSCNEQDFCLFDMI